MGLLNLTLGQLLAVFRLDQSLVDEGGAVLADGDTAARQHLVLGLETDEGGEFLLHLVQPLLGKSLLLQEGVRLGVLKGLSDLLKLRVKT